MSAPGRPSLSVEDLAVGAGLLARLPGFLRRPLDLQQSHAELRQRLARREADFLRFARLAIYGQSRSPYRELLGLAGCELGDLERLVSREGLEGALHQLLRAGVYLTADELRGLRPARRGSATLTIDPRRLRNPLAQHHLGKRSGGTRGAELPITIDLRSLRDSAVDHQLVHAARGALDWQHVVWQVPGSAAVTQLVRWAMGGVRTAGWFSQLDARDPTLHPRYRWSARLLRWGSLLANNPIPAMRYAPLDDPAPLLAWLAGAAANRRTRHVRTNASCAVRLCEAPAAAGLDLAGVRFTIGGEPVTERRLAILRKVGASAYPMCGATECDTVSQGCLKPTAPDDMHLLHDLNAVIQPGPDAALAPLPPRALLITALRPHARLVLLNACIGDEGTLEQRACGCPLERLGWTTHLHALRSFEKLTAGGMSLLDADVIQVLEQVLPGKFGGGPTDYQLREEESETGRPRLTLVVHPRLGPLDEAALTATFLDAIGQGPGAQRVVALSWLRGALVRVERRPPAATAVAKIVHLTRRPVG
jgi:hypothetical protein